MKKLRFVPTDGYKGVFDYTAGQFLTIRIPELQSCPRHYTLISQPNTANYFECAVRRVQKGLYSNYINSSMRVGDKVLVSAPYGAPKMHATEKFAMAVAGSGVTTAMAFLGSSNIKNFQSGLFINRSDLETPFRNDLETFSTAAGGSSTRFLTTATHGRPNLEKEAESLIEACGGTEEVINKNKTWFHICGPDSFMGEMAGALSKLGVQKMHSYRYGPSISFANMIRLASQFPLSQ
eukprot:Filipodium_phascolosomae@DN370_c0_g1_i11.p1